MGSELQWWHIILPLITGGAFGAVITALVTSYKNRIQPVGHRIDLRPVFRGSKTALNAKITISDGTNEHQFHNLFLFEVEIVNKGNQDIKEFPLGFTLKNGAEAIYAEYKSPDRHHTVSPSGVSPSTPKSEMDITIKPFNRGDLYSFYLYVVIPEGLKEPQTVNLSSSYPIKFVDIPTIGEMVAQTAASITIGSIRLTFGGS
jgi:hypothetical protein